VAERIVEVQAVSELRVRRAAHIAEAATAVIAEVGACHRGPGTGKRRPFSQSATKTINGGQKQNVVPFSGKKPQVSVPNSSRFKLRIVF